MQIEERPILSNLFRTSIVVGDDPLIFFIKESAFPQTRRFRSHGEQEQHCDTATETNSNNHF